MGQPNCRGPPTTIEPLHSPYNSMALLDYYKGGPPPCCPAHSSAFRCMQRTKGSSYGSWGPTIREGPYYSMAGRRIATIGLGGPYYSP